MVSDGSKSSSHSREESGFPGASSGRRGRRKSGKKTRPLDENALRDLALSYVARFATTGAKLEAYLARKLRERGVAEDDDGREVRLDVTGIVARLIELGYVDDAAYARSRSRDLTARGYGARRVEQALWAAGVEEEVRGESAPGEADCRRAAILLAKKRRFGPFGTAPDPEEARDETHKRREKQVAAMLRAGHDYAHVAFILDAENEGEVDEWLAEAEEEQRQEENGPW
jgi:regulatory protein